MLHIDFNGLMPVWLLQALASAYISGLIPDRYIGSIVILANMVYRSQDFVDKAKELSTNLLTILDIFRELDEEVRDNSPNRQAIFLSFHEIAQIVAAKQILNTYGLPPELEKITADFKEMDISLGDYVWEVKPGYAAYSSFLNSIN